MLGGVGIQLRRVLLNDSQLIYTREYWSGDSRDGNLINGDGYHYFKMTALGKILEAYEYYEQDDGCGIVSPLPEMQNVDWIKDLGFDDMEVLDMINEGEFNRIKNMVKKK